MSRSSWFVVWLSLVVLAPQLLSAQAAAPPDDGSASQEPTLVLPVRPLSSEEVTPPPNSMPLVVSGNPFPSPVVVEVVQDENLGDFQVQEAVPGELPPPADDPATATDILLPGAVDEGVVVEAPEVVVFPDGEVDPEALATGEGIELDDLPLPPEVVLYTPPTPEEIGPEYPPIPETFPPVELPPELGQPPVLDPVASQVVNEGNTLTLILSASDPDPGQTVAIYTSVLPLGATFEGNTFSWVPAFSQAGTYQVAFAAQDNGTLPLLSAQQTITITVNNVNLPPLADAGEDQTAHVGGTVTLDGSQSIDIDGGTLSYTWQPLNVPGFTDNNNGTASFAPAAPGVYTFTLEVDDGQGGIASDEVVVTVPNRPPVAIAGPDQSANVGDLVTLDGSASDDPDGSAGLEPGPKKKEHFPTKGGGLQYLWTQIDGPPVKLPIKKGFGGPAAISFQVTAPGVYTFSLVVNDGELDSAPDVVVVTVINPNQPPVANAGADQSVEATGPSTAVALNGASSADPDGDALSYSWSENGAEVSTEASPTLSLGLGPHTFTLTVDDGKGGSASDEVVVQVVDTTPPVLVLNGPNPLLLELGTPYPETGASASDLVDGDLSASIQTSGGVDVNAEGSNTITYSVADAVGNPASVSRTVQVVVTPNSYGLIATHSLHLRQSARITSGFAGVVEQGQAPFLAGKVELVVGTRVQTAEGVRLSAPRVRVRQHADIDGELVYNQLVAVGKHATITQQTQVPASYFPLFQGSGLPAFLTATPGSQDVEVKQKKSATLNAGAYDEVRVKQKGTLTFAGGTYHLGDLDVGPNADLRFLAPTTLLIRGQLSLDQGSSFGPASGSGIDASDILVYVEGRNGRLGHGHDDDEGDDEEDDAEGRNLRKSPRAAKIGVRVSFQGNLYAPNGTVHLRQGSAAVGSFIAQDIIVGVRVQVAAQSGWNTPGVIYQPQAPAALAKLAGAAGEAGVLPEGAGLRANYPNPFNPSTAIPYVLVEIAPVKLSVYNVLGQQVRVLVDQLQVPGTYTVSWDGQDATGLQAAGGVYFYRLQAGEHIQVRKMLFAK